MPTRTPRLPLLPAQRCCSLWDGCTIARAETIHYLGQDSLVGRVPGKRVAYLLILSVVLLVGMFAAVPARAQARAAPRDLAGNAARASGMQARATPSVGSGPLEELTVASLGLPAQTVYGSRATVDVEFPAPSGPLGPQGSVVRVFFSHSTGLGPGSNLTVAVNGDRLDRITLDDTTAQGGVFDAQIPAANLHQDAANEVEAEWTLTSPRSVRAFGTLAPETLLDYAVAGDPGSLATFPYSMLEGLPETTLRLGVVLPQHPDGTEIGSAMSAVAALAQAVPGRHVDPQLLPATTSDPAGEPLLVVGRTEGFPLLDHLLAGAGFEVNGGSPAGPGSATPVPARAGVLATALVPATGGARAWVISGQTDQDVEMAARALIERPGDYRGDAAVVDSDTPAVSPPLPSLTALLAQARVTPGQSEQRIVLGFPLPRPLGGAATLHLELLPGATRLATDALDVSANGHPLFPVASGLQQGDTELAVSVPAGVLRPGFNGIALTLRGTGSTDAAPPLDISRTRLSLPPPTAGSSLRDLPDPFLGGAGGTPMVVLANHDPGLVRAALAGAAGLGSRSLLSPPVFHVSSAAGRLHIGEAGLIVFGVPGGGSQLRVSGSTGARIDPPRSSSGGGWVEDVRLPGDSGPILWVAGANAPATAAAASLLGSPRLGGIAATTRSPAQSTGGSSTVVEASSLPGALTLAVAILVAAWLAVVASLELWRRRGGRRTGAR